MIKINKTRFIPLLLILLLVGMMVVPAMRVSAQTPVALNTTSNFAVLAGTTITNTGTTTISGDVGLSPGTAITGQAQMVIATGDSFYVADSVALQAQNDLITAYNDAAGRTPVTRIPTELGGTTLTPGTYDSASGTFEITGTLTLNAQGNPDGVFVFKTASTLITADNSNVVLINSARFCRTFWQVGSSATLGANSTFVGHIFASASITATTGATVYGQLLARNGAVTLNSNTIINGPCPDQTGSLTVTKVVSGLPSGQTQPDFAIKITGPSYTTGNSKTFNVANGLVQTWTGLTPGAYTITEATPTGWTTTLPAASIPVTAGATATATVTNTYSGGGSSTGSLTVTKVVSGLPSGQTQPDFTIQITGPSYTAGNSKTFNVANGLVQTWTGLTPGAYTITEAPPTGWSTTLPAASIPVTAGATATATVTNTYSSGGSGGGGGSSTIYPPLINVIKTPAPLALTSGQGSVTYTYKVTNPGMVTLSNVSVTDDKVSLVNYVSGDVNADNLLQTNETWIYTSKVNLNATTTNTATAKGSANGMTATDLAFATVVVSSVALPGAASPPLINVVKTPAPLALSAGPGSVIYTYKVTNPGMVALSNVSVTDDKVSPVNYVSGDVNADNLLQPDETWIYTATGNLSATTMNTATAKGSANGMTATDIAYATVIVTPPIVVTPTVPVYTPPTPQLPQTGSGTDEKTLPWLFPVGVLAMMLLLIALPVIKRRISSSKR